MTSARATEQPGLSTPPCSRMGMATVALVLIWPLAGPVRAQSMVLASPPQNVLQLSAEASAEVPQDMLAITLQLLREGSDAAAVQSQLRQALEAALAEARKAQRPGQVDVRSGAFSVYPRYGQNQPKPVISGWQGQAELVLEGRDLTAISQLAGRLTGLNVVRVAFGLSKETRERSTDEISTEAITRFRARAASLSQQFGFAGYSLREIAITGGDTPGMPAMPMLRRSASMASADSAESQPLAPGKATVSVSVSGTVQMSPR